jgi:hypothetical protein
MDKLKAFFKKLMGNASDKPATSGTTGTKTETPASPAVPKSTLPVQHPPVDWSKWEPAGEGDCASFCLLLFRLTYTYSAPNLI